MNICIIGTGYVGLVTGTCFSEMGNNVICVDNNQTKIESLKNGLLPIYEPGLQELVNRNLAEGRLTFTSDIRSAIRDSLVCFIAVGTPSSPDGSVDLANYLEVVSIIADNIQRYTIIINKSTVPVGTAEEAREIISNRLNKRCLKVDFDIVSNPEFLKEGTAVEDFLRPDRIIIGCESENARTILHQLYEPFVKNQHPIIDMDTKSAEISKYAANTFLATKISFMNELARLCDSIGGDISKVRLGIGSDPRIGMQFLYSGIGFGGSCFPKDVRELASLGERSGIKMNIASAIIEVNETQKEYLIQLIQKRFGNNLSNMTFGIWGLAFKPQTDDVREAPSLVIIEKLIGLGAKIKAYDPEAINQAKLYLHRFSENIEYCKDMFEVLKGSDALILATEWRQFRQPDYSLLKNLLNNPIIFDGRNQYEPTKLKDLGFEYYCIGRNNNGK